MRLPTGAVAAGAGALALIMGWEGLRLTAYIPVPGDPYTIGYGHTGKDVTMDRVVSREEARELLMLDVERVERGMRNCVRVPLSQSEWDAYTSFTYNVGTKAFCTSTLVKLLNQGKRVEACQQLDRWVYSGGIKYQGLVKRRTAEKALCLKGAATE